MVAAVIVQGNDDNNAKPQPRGGQMWLHNGKSDCCRKKIGQNMLERVTVNCYEGHGCCPLVMLFVNALVEKAMVKQPDIYQS